MMDKISMGIMAALIFIAGARPAPAESGYEACRDNFQSHSDCVNAGAGYGACRDNFQSHSDCINAGAGYGACRANFQSHSDCVNAGAGYGACRANFQSHSDCVNAGAGYEASRDNFQSHSDSLNAGAGYEACRDNFQSHSDCINAGAGYGACRDNFQSHSDCLAAGEGYEASRDNFQSHSDSLKVGAGNAVTEDKTPQTDATGDIAKATPSAAKTATPSADTISTDKNLTTPWVNDCYKQGLSQGLSADAAIKQCTNSWDSKTDEEKSKSAVELGDRTGVSQLKDGDPSINAEPYFSPDKLPEIAENKEQGFWDKILALWNRLIGK